MLLSSTCPESGMLRFHTPVASLLQCCTDSAHTILHTLQALADDDFMGVYNHRPSYGGACISASSRRCLSTVPDREYIFISSSYT